MATRGEALPGPIIGVAHGIQQRTEQDQAIAERSWAIWTFRVDRYDESGNPLPPVPVEMRGRSFEGFISEGDQVELPIDASRAWHPGALVRVTHVRNISTGAAVEARGDATQTHPVVGLIVAIIFVVAFLAAGLSFVAFASWIPLPIVIGGVLFSAIPAIVLLGVGINALAKRRRKS